MSSYLIIAVFVLLVINVVMLLVMLLRGDRQDLPVSNNAVRAREARSARSRA